MAFDESTAQGISETIQRFYELLKFEPGGQPRWNEMQLLFHPGALIIPPTSDTAGISTPLTFSGFADLFRKDFEQLRGDGFTEREIFESTHTFGAVAQRMSGYEITVGTSTIAFRGVNMFQLLRHDATWRIASLIWDRH